MFLRLWLLLLVDHTVKLLQRCRSWISAPIIGAVIVTTAGVIIVLIRAAIEIVVKYDVIVERIVVEIATDMNTSHCCGCI